MGLSASQGRLLLLTARRSDLELRAQSISQKRLAISQRLEEVSTEYENACSNRQMKMSLFLNGSAATDAENVQRTSNLTYATLVSGTLTQFSSAQSGIVAYDGTSNIEYASTSAFRLVDADGAIVVSSIEEIPGTVKTTFTTPATSAVDKDGNDLKIANLYQTGSKDENGKFSESSYYALAEKKR